MDKTPPEAGSGSKSRARQRPYMGETVRRRLNLEAGQNPAFFSGFVQKVSTCACAWTGARLTVYVRADGHLTPPVG